MVFKRYIHRHGKKLGPYYYENIRGPDGNVKTIYVGTNPHHHTKHRVRKPLFFIILVLVLILIAGTLLFVMQNKNYLIKKVKPQQSDFDVDQILLKVLVKSKESLEKEIRVMNTGSELASISIEAYGLSDIVKIDAPSFTIKPDQTKIVALNFSSFDEERKIEQQPGVYIGKLIVKSEKASKEIPAVVEIETKNVLFDLNLNPVAFDRKIKQGTDTTIEVRLFNLESIESTNVDVDYFVKDINSNTIVTESETVVVKTQASFFKTVSIPKNLKPGPYIFAAEARFGNSVGTASYLFEVVGPEEASFSQFCKNNVLCLGLSLTTILLLFALMAYFYFFIGAYLYERFTGVVRLPEKREEEEKFEEIEEVEKAVKAAKPGIFETISGKFYDWSKERETANAEKEKQKREDELRQLAEERGKALEKKISEPSKKLRKFYKIMDEAHEALIGNDASNIDELYAKEEDLYAGLSDEEKQEVHDKLTELYNHQNKFLELRKLHEESIKKEKLSKQEQLARQKAEEEQRKKQEELAGQKAEEKRKKKLEREKLSEKRKEKFKEFLHKFGLFKTPEEKAQIELQKERERQERQRREENLRKQRKEERRRKQLEEDKRKQEDVRRQEETRNQKELEKQKAEEEKIKKAEELRIQKEAGAKQKESEKQRQEQIKAEKLEAANQIEAKLKGNKEAAELLNSKLARIESEKELLLGSISEFDARVRNIEQKILVKTKNIEELKLQRNSLTENYKKQAAELYEKLEIQKTAQASKTKELKEKLEAKQSALTKALEEELSKLSPEKRKATEKWKRLELKAKLKIEEHALEEELKKYEGKGIDKKEIEQNYKKSLQEINKKQAGLKQEIEDLESRKEQILGEKIKILDDLQNKENKIQKININLENCAREQQQLNADLSKLKAELKIRFFSNLISGIGRLQSKLEENKKKIRQPEEQKRKQEELRKQEVLKKQLGQEKIQKELPNLKQEAKPRFVFLRDLISKYKQKIQDRRKEKEQKKAILETAKRVGEELKQKEPKEKAIKEKIKKQEEKFGLLEQEIKKKQGEEKQIVKEIKPSLFERLFKKERESKSKEIERKPGEEPEAKKPTVFGRLFGKIKTGKPVEEKEKPTEEVEKKSLTEAEELEESIRKLGLFKELERGELGIKEEKKKPGIFSKLIKKVTEKTTQQKKIKGPKQSNASELRSERTRSQLTEKIPQKSRKLENFHKAFREAKEAIGKNEIPKAKNLYAESRNLYADLSNDEKKEVYGELMEMYNKISGK